MRHQILLLLALCGAPAGLLCQTHPGSPNLPPGTIDGSKTPELVPDRVAFRLVLLSLLVPARADEKHFKKQQVIFERMGLSNADRSTFLEVLTVFESGYSAAMASKAATGIKPDPQIWSVVQSARDTLQSRLTTEGNTKFIQFVTNAKKRMIVHE